MLADEQAEPGDPYLGPVPDDGLQVIALQERLPHGELVPRLTSCRAPRQDDAISAIQPAPHFVAKPVEQLDLTAVPQPQDARHLVGDARGNREPLPRDGRRVHKEPMHRTKPNWAMNRAGAPSRQIQTAAALSRVAGSESAFLLP
jgi:hypothetical protein